MSRSLEQRLRDSDSRYRMLADNLDDVIWVLDPQDLTFVYISETVSKTRGYTAREVMGHSLGEVLRPDDLKWAESKLAEELEKYQRGEEPRLTMELQVKHKSGGLVWVEVATRFFRDDDGQPLVIGITRDISKRKIWESEREALLLQLKNTIAEQKRLAEENRILMGLLPICVKCKKIRDDNGRWHQLEAYIEEHSQASFTHTICPACKDLLYPGLKKGGNGQ